MEAVNAQRYLTLLRETVVPCLIQRGQIANVTFMQDGATCHTANPVKAFLIQTFGEDRIVSRRWRYPWPPRFPDLTPADFWLKSLVCASPVDSDEALVARIAVVAGETREMPGLFAYVRHSL
ncbi:uncharacterized protein TNCV_4758111 [Trichonephila clavipes]|nr:uncharacterized protein TNCV_4758111 [Trichonephila clavipes]